MRTRTTAARRVAGWWPAVGGEDASFGRVVGPLRVAQCQGESTRPRDGYEWRCLEVVGVVRCTVRRPVHTGVRAICRKSAIDLVAEKRRSLIFFRNEK